MTEKLTYQKPTALLEKFGSEDIMTLSDGGADHNITAVGWVHKEDGMLS